MKPTYEELIEALKDMALQYLSDVDGNIMTHDFTLAGENCLDILNRLGKVKSDNGISYVFKDQYRIFGIESSESLELYVDESEIVEKCKDIWNNPEKYSKFKAGTEETYYEFLKFLWVEYPNRDERQLADIACELINDSPQK